MAIQIGMKALSSMKMLENTADEAGNEYRVYQIPKSKLRLHCRRSFRKPNGEFLPGLVKDEKGEILWTFKSENFTKGISRIVIVDGQVAIALVSKNYLYKLIFVSDLGSSVAVGVGENEVVNLGGTRGVAEMVALRHRVAAAFGPRVEAVMTDDEKIFLAKIREAEKALAKSYREERETIRKERLAEITARPNISGYTENGKCRFGIPVVGNEWQLLDDGIGVVLVDGFSETSEPVGEKAVAFFTGKDKGGKPRQQAPAEITLRGGRQGKPVVADENKPVCKVSSCQRISFISFGNDHLPRGVHEADLVDLEGFKAIRKTRLNSGTLIAIPAKEEGHVQIHRMLGEKGCDTLGIFKMIS